MKNINKKIIYGIIFLFLMVTYFFFRQIEKEYLTIVTFDDCVAAGYPVLTTYPEQCKIPGKIFTNTVQVASKTEEKEVSPEKMMNPKNASYTIEGNSIELVHGVASSTEGDITYFGNELMIDLDNDTKEDTAFILKQNSKGSGIFYYAVVALNKKDGYVGTNGILLGDRIAPQSTEYRNNELVISYADREQGEPMTKKPSVAISRYFKVTDDVLVEIIK